MTNTGDENVPDTPRELTDPRLTWPHCSPDAYDYHEPENDSECKDPECPGRVPPRPEVAGA